MSRCEYAYLYICSKELRLELINILTFKPGSPLGPDGPRGPGDPYN